MPLAFQALAEQHWVKAKGLLLRLTPHHKDLSITVYQGLLPTASLEHNKCLTWLQAFHNVWNTVELATLTSKPPKTISMTGTPDHCLPF